MPVISDIAILGNVAVSGAQCSAYAVSRFSSPPAGGSGAPDANPPDGTAVTSGITYGGAGRFRITVPNPGDYYVMVSLTGTIAWGGPYRAGGADVYDVKEYGAAGDGVTDDTTAIAAAITAAATSGGTVFFPAGTYITGLQTVNSKVHYRGAGIEATILKLKSSANTALVQGASFGSLTGGNTTGGVFNWSIQEMTLDGNKASQSGGAAVLQVYGYGYVIQNVRIRSGFGDGIYSEWSTSGGSPGQDSMEAQLANVKVHDCGSHGVEWVGPHDSQWVDVISYSNSARGVWVHGGGNSLLATNCHSWGNSQTYAWYLEGSACHLVNCEAEGASTAQLFLGANDCSYRGGSVFAAGGGTTGIVVGDGTHTSLSGLVVDTKVLNCTTAAISLAQDGGGNVFKINAFQASGSVSTGTLNINSNAEFVANGGGTGALASYHSQVQIHDGLSLRLYHSTDNSWADTSFDGSQVTSSWPIRGTNFVGVNSGSAYYSASGAPSSGTGSNGDYYFRTDTPGTANQRIYVKSAGSWVGIV